MSSYPARYQRPGARVAALTERPADLRRRRVHARERPANTASGRALGGERATDSPGRTHPRFPVIGVAETSSYLFAAGADGGRPHPVVPARHLQARSDGLAGRRRPRGGRIPRPAAATVSEGTRTCSAPTCRLRFSWVSARTQFWAGGGRTRSPALLSPPLPRVKASKVGTATTALRAAARPYGGSG